MRRAACCRPSLDVQLRACAVVGVSNAYVYVVRARVGAVNGVFRAGSTFVHLVGVLSFEIVRCEQRVECNVCRGAVAAWMPARGDLRSRAGVEGALRERMCAPW